MILPVHPDATIRTASALMRGEQVDALLVAAPERGPAAETTVLSAGDIVTRVVALGLDPEVLTVGDVLRLLGDDPV